MSVYIEEIRSIPVDSYGDVRTLVRGLPYQCPDDWQDVLESLDEDSELYLVKEPNNPKDELAIAAYLDDRRVGYVAADDNTKVWMFLTDEKTPCRLIKKYEASFKVAFDNPRPLFENMAFEDIYKGRDGWIDKDRPVMNVPFLTDKNDDNYDWYRDRVIIRDYEEMIPDFRRKLAAKMITFIARKNSRGRYLYYLPYYNDAVALVEDDLIKSFIDTDGFVIAIPDMCLKTYPGGINMDLNVARLKRGNPLLKEFRAVEEKGGHELAFYLHSPEDTPLYKEEDKANIKDKQDDMNSSERTKCVTLKHFFSFDGASVVEVYKVQKMCKQLLEVRSINCYAQKQVGSIAIFLEDGTLFHTVTNSAEYNMLNSILQKEKLLVGEVTGDLNLATEHYFLIKLYYDYISGNHDPYDIVKLWMRDFMAQLKHVSVPKAKYVGTESKADALEKKSTKIEFPCYEDDDYESFDFSKLNLTQAELNDEIIRVTDKHQEDLYHNSPFVVLAEQNPALPSIYDLCLPDGSMFSIIGDEEPEDLKLREWISEVGIVPVTVQSYERITSTCLDLHFRAFKRKTRSQEIDDFVSAHFIEDTVDIEIEDDVYERIVDIIDPKHDHSMTEDLNVAAIIPNWASQAGYYILGDGKPIWLAPSYNADILDQVHQNDGTRGRVISYSDNYDGTYHFELKFHIEK